MRFHEPWTRIWATAQPRAQLSANGTSRVEEGPAPDGPTA